MIYRAMIGVAALALVLASPTAAERPAVPDDFARYQVPGHQAQMESLRRLYWIHYAGVDGGRRAQPLSTLWDEWMAAPSLWPAYGERMHANRQEWREKLLGREIYPDGYVSSHMGGGLAHRGGWPFPNWWQGRGGVGGWYFSFEGISDWPGRAEAPDTPEGWRVTGLEDRDVEGGTWNLVITSPRATITAPAIRFGHHLAMQPPTPEGADAPDQQTLDPAQSPFVQLRWRASGIEDAQPYIEWRRKSDDAFSPHRRFYFAPVESDEIVRTEIPLYQHPQWVGEITHLRIGLSNPRPEGTVGIQSLATQFDSRHNINAQSFITASTDYFWWTRDLNFLRENINRMRTALRYMMREHRTLEENVVLTEWVGHTGRAALSYDQQGTKRVHYGEGVGNNYWDLLPFGYEDCYATLRYYAVLQRMARLEREIQDHPQWNVPRGALALDPDALLRHAREVKEEGNRRFWNEKTGRFVPGVDADGNKHDYGITFLNLEAIHYGFANEEHAEQIMSWITGERNIEGDTSQGEDIYRWRFGPRSTTKRNVSFYGWYWWGPDQIPWGAQVQDGGAVLGFTYHDLMSRIRVLGPDNAWQRLQEIIQWFDDVMAAGTYRDYYAQQEGVTLQGGGTAGGLGMDHEFFESVLVTQVMLNGFLGFTPTGDGFRIDPRLPSDWPELTISRIHLHDQVLRITARPGEIEVAREGPTVELLYVHLPEGDWQATFFDENGDETAGRLVEPDARGAHELQMNEAVRVRLNKK